MNSKFSSTENTPASSQRSSWTKSNGKPKRPLSSYNLYFQVERARILKFGMRREYPLVYHPEEVLKMSHWHKVRPRRPHRKSHGRVSFHDMARIISARWKDLDQRNRQVFADQAKLEKAEYKRRVKAWEAGETEQPTFLPFVSQSDQQQSSSSSISLPQHEQNDTACSPQHDHQWNKNDDLLLERELSGIALLPRPITALSFHTSTSSVDSLETAAEDSLTATRNEEFWDVASSDSETNFLDTGDIDQIVEVYHHQHKHDDLPTAMTLCDESLFDEPTKQEAQEEPCSTRRKGDSAFVLTQPGDGNLTDVFEADFMNALLRFDNC